jgi:hypothetical protein
VRQGTRPAWKSSARAYVGNDPINRIDPKGTDNWLIEWEELHRTRNKYNKCPPHPPQPVCSNEDNRSWEQDPDLKKYGLDMPGAGGKWRGSDGSECEYDSNGNLVPGNVSFNYCPNPWKGCHFFMDFLPHYVLGPGAGGPTQYGYP